MPPDVPIRGGSRTDAGVVLDRELMALAGVDARCRLVVARLVRRLIDGRLWRPLGFVRLSDYARERVGASARTLEEDARVVRALDDLPRLRAAFESGSLNWTRIRMLVRAATAQNEVELLRHALALTVQELEAFLKARAASSEALAASVRMTSSDGPVASAEMASVDGPTASADMAPSGRPAASEGCVTSPSPAHDEEDPEIRWSIPVSRRGRRLWRAACELASRTAGSPLTQAQVLEIVAAEAAGAAPVAPGATLPSYDDVARRLRSAHRSDEARGRRMLLAFIAETGVSEGFEWLATPSITRGPAELLDALLADLDHIDAAELDRRLQEARRAMQRIDWQMAALLRIGIDRRLFREIGFATVKLYVESRLGRCARSIWQLVAIERETWRSCTELGDAWRDGRLSTLAASALIPVIGPSFGHAWIERAGEVTLRRLVDEVAWALDYGDRKTRSGRPAPPPPAADVRIDCAPDVTDEEVQIGAHGDDVRWIPDRMEHVRLSFHVPLSVAALVETVLRHPGERTERRERAFERIVAAALLEWTAAPRHPDPVFERDGWRCTVPGCSSRRNLHDHHIVFRSHGGQNARDNRTTVCAAHHLHGIHAGVIRASGVAPAGILWELGCGNGKEPLLRLRGDRYL